MLIDFARYKLYQRKCMFRYLDNEFTELFIQFKKNNEWVVNTISIYSYYLLTINTDINQIHEAAQIVFHSVSVLWRSLISQCKIVWVMKYWIVLGQGP